MPETELTKTIKARCRYFRPAMNSSMRIIRWAEEVTIDTGRVDVIRFEDYIEEDKSFCRWKEAGQQCKNGYSEYGINKCRGCVHTHHVYVLGILTTCFEVKISLSDFKSKNGHNFYGNRNYYVVPADLVKRVLPLVPEGIGLIAHYESGHMTVKKECAHREITEEELSYLLYNALKKWCS